MEQKHICASICDRLPTLSANHPWLVDHNLEDDDDIRDHIIYTIHDPPSQHMYRIPSFLGKRIRGCSYGWVILSNHPLNDMWSLWNPVTSKVIRLPRLVSRNEDPGTNIMQQCCLSSPPDEPGAVFIVTAEKYTIVFCRLDRKRRKLKWVQMSYAKQMRSVAGCDGYLGGLTSCNSKVYALATLHQVLYVLHIEILVKGKETVIRLLPYMEVPCYYTKYCLNTICFLIGCCTELFYITLGLNEVGRITKRTVGAVLVFKLDTTNTRWEDMDDLTGAAFFLDLAHDFSSFYSAAVPSGLGGYVHFLDISGKVLHSYNIKSKTIASSPMPTSSACRLQGLHGEIKSQQDEGRGNEMAERDDEVDSTSTMIGTDEENMESGLVDTPFDVLKTIMEFCVGIEYLNLRATCKQCHLAAPMIQWSKGGRLQSYSLASSPWLMVLDEYQGVMSFTDPMFGDKYFITTPPQLIGGDVKIYCSMYGWVLMRKHMRPLTFFNPFTARGSWPVYIHLVNRERSWHRLRLNFCGDKYRSFYFATRYGENVYALYNNGGIAFVDTDNQDYTFLECPTSSCQSTKQNFLMKCDQHLLLVIMGEFGECLEVFKLNDSTEWEKIESLGRHAIYICDDACLCVEAKTTEMANKIYFPRLHPAYKKIVFYSLETRRYHTSNTEESFGDFMGTERHLNPHVWIEPSWSS